MTEIRTMTVSPAPDWKVGKQNRTVVASEITRVRIVHSWWAGRTIGRWFIRRWSLAAATAEPDQVRPPTTIARPAVKYEKVFISPMSTVRVRIPAIIEARPPKPFSRPTIWGIWIIRTLREIHKPTTAPISMPIHSSMTVMMPKYQSVSRIAAPMDAAPIRLPVGAFSTLLIMEMPTSTRMARAAEMT